MDWTFADDRPIYAQLVEQIERAVVAGVYPPGAKLPGVRELAADAGVNPNTMQRALAELETRGLVRAERTSGRFVTQDTGRIAALQQTLARALTRDYLAALRALGCTDEEIETLVREGTAPPGAGPGG